jgi:hypothetical protein
MRTTINPMAERPTTVRFRADINTAIREVADEMGVSFNAALSVLVTEALRARGRRPGSATTAEGNKATHD